MTKIDSTLDNIRIVLSEPWHPGNIGAVARAMATMDLSQLYLVRPKEFPSFEAERRAAGAVETLNNAIVVETLEEAVGDCTLIIGGSARSRTRPHLVLGPREAATKAVEEAGQGAHVALVFGTERTGLLNQELDQCTYHLRIPTSANFSSLNLASCVQIVCYEIFMASLTDRPEPETEDSSLYPSGSDMEYFYKHLQEALDHRGFVPKEMREPTMQKLRRLFGRARPEVGELKLLHSLVRLMKG
ncbi:MAG: RNA methyltransferase [Deltaproteobacteria bacterium]|nr:RNA methyltransferase [Deltaproteobacteria bacterium]